MKVTPDARWEEVLALISDSVTPQQYATWFKPLVFLHYKEAERTVTIQVASRYVCEYLEGNYVELFRHVLRQVFGEHTQLQYFVAKSQDNEIGEPPMMQSEMQAAPARQPQRQRMVQPQRGEAQGPQRLDPRLNPRQTFDNYIEGASNKLPRSVGQSIAEHPNNSKFNPMFIYGPPGCGKTHLINAIGVHVCNKYPEKRVLYVSARLFEVQYTSAVMRKTINDFILFYQSIDVLIVDDVQEWEGKPGTQNTFFHIFNHLFRNGKRIILASDRPPVELKDMPDRLLTRFSCGLVCELEKPNIQLCVDILSNKIRRDGLKIPVDVISFIAQTCNGSVRDLQGAINGLLAYSIVYNSSIDIRLAERVIKRAVKVDDKPLTIDDIVETVCHHYNVTVTAVNSKSRKRDYVVARQVTMYLAQKYTKMPASRIGKLVGNRDHSTVIHSCSKVEERLKIDAGFSDELVSIENGLKVKRA